MGVRSSPEAPDTSPYPAYSGCYYHPFTLGTVMGIQAGWAVPAFDEYGRQALRQHVPTLIEVADDEAQRFACNAVVVGQDAEDRIGQGQARQWRRHRGKDTGAGAIHRDELDR